jgi:hypothetical protein
MSFFTCCMVTVVAGALGVRRRLLWVGILWVRCGDQEQEKRKTTRRIYRLFAILLLRRRPNYSIRRLFSSSLNPHFPVIPYHLIVRFSLVQSTLRFLPGLSHPPIHPSIHPSYSIHLHTSLFGPDVDRSTPRMRSKLINNASHTCIPRDMMPLLSGWHQVSCAHMESSRRCSYLVERVARLND